MLGVAYENTFTQSMQSSVLEGLSAGTEITVRVDRGWDDGTWQDAVGSVAGREQHTVSRDLNHARVRVQTRV